MLARVERAVEALHGRGVVFGDLHPFNVLVEGERVVLVDFEVATLAEDGARPALAHPGFCPPPDRLGVRADRYSLACLRLGIFAPMSTVLIPLHRPKAAHLAELVRRVFPVPRATLGEAVSTILGTPPATGTDPADVTAGPEAVPLGDLPLPGRAPWTSVRDAACRAIVASATPERGDRLFPGDVAQFQPGGGVNLANGAAGVLYALAETGAGRFPRYEDWLRERAFAPAPGTGLGFYDGLHGVAYAFESLGRRQDALDLVELCLREDWEQLGQSLYGGLAGIGLNLLHLGQETGEHALERAALRVAEVVADRLGAVEDVPEVSGGGDPHAGLMRGSSGPALLFLRAYELTGEGALLDHARVALRQDLRRCTHRADGQLQVEQGWRTNPYLDEGSAGIGVVLRQYLAHRHDEEFRQALDAIGPVATLEYYVQAGLFAGRAGMIAALSLGLRPAVTGYSLEVTGQIERLAWHAMPYGGGLAFPGDQLLRLSMDLATGTAGVLLALGTALHDRPVRVPLISPPGIPAGTADPATSKGGD
jgi:hypothetical protein